MSQIILEHLIERLRQAAIYNRHDLAPPSVVLWTDGEGLWTPVIPLIREAMPELLVLSPEVQGEDAGPSTWVRYQLARRPWAKPPVLYLPGVAHQAFRGAAGFPEAARHLFALQFQGQFWTQQKTASSPPWSAWWREGDLGPGLATLVSGTAGIPWGTQGPGPGPAKGPVRRGQRALPRHQSDAGGRPAQGPRRFGEAAEGTGPGAHPHCGSS